MNSIARINRFATSVFIVTFSCALSSGQVRKQRSPSRTATPSLTARQIAQKATRSLVLVLTKDSDGESIAQGSGFFFKPDLVVTNLHVLKRAAQGEIELVNSGVRHKISEVVAVDLKHDICVLKINGVLAPTLSLNGSRQDNVGDDVYVAGNPEGLKGSLSKGIVSALRPDEDLIQIDASISPGSSGGPVINSGGEVIGIAVGAITRGQHLNFAVPVKFLSNLPLVQHFEVNVVGALALNDKENQKLEGGVRTILIKESSYRYSRREDRCIEGEIRLKEKIVFNTSGNLTDENTYTSKGLILSQYQHKYDSRGFKTSVTAVIAGGSPTESKFSESEWIEHQYKFRRYSNTTELDDGSTFKYDRNGNQIEVVYLSEGKRISAIYKYDEARRLIEERLHENGRPMWSYRYKYEFDDHRNWIKQIKLRQDIDNPCDPTFPPEIVYREITYYEF